MIEDGGKAAPEGRAPECGASEHDGLEKPVPESAPEEYIDRDPEFYYSRERRLSRASREVLALNDGKAIRPGIKNTLFAFKGNIMVLASIIAICAMFGMMRFSNQERALTLGGNTLGAAVLEEEGALILSVIKQAPLEGGAYTGEVDIAVSQIAPKPPAEEDPQIFTHRVVFHEDDSEEYYVSLPFVGRGFLAVFKAGEEQKSAILRVK